MTETQTTTQPQPAAAPNPQPAAPTPPAQTAGAAQPGAYQPPAGSVVVNESEWNQARRHAEQYRGFEPMVRRLVEAGVKDAGSLDPLLSAHQTARSRGLDLPRLLDVLAPSNSSGAQTGASQPAAQPAAGGDLDQRFAQFRAEMAQTNHDAQMQVQERMSANLINELAGANASAEMKSITNAVVNEFLLQESKRYPKGHPLYDKELMPLTEADFRAASEKARNALRTMRGEQIIASANGSPTAGSTPAAPSAPTGGPSGSVPFSKQPSDQKLSYARQMYQRLGATA